jgi:ABC-2 type transport system permease protein
VTADAAASPLPANQGGRPKPVRTVSARVSVRDRVLEIWRSRELLSYLISTEIKVKYKNSALGLLWSMVAPAMSLMIFWFVFGVVLKNAYPSFVIYLFSGLLFWNFFSTAVSSATRVIVDRAGIVKKVAFPREILALSSVGTAMVFMFFQTAVLILFMVVLQHAPAWGMLPLLIPALLATTVIAAALGILLSAANVYLRDMSHLIEIVLQAWFWACPVVYSFWSQIQPRMGHWYIVYLMNPMAPIILTSQRVIYAQPTVQLTTPDHPTVQLLPSWSGWTYLAMDSILVVAGLALLWIALAVFGRLEGNFAEEL